MSAYDIDAYNEGWEDGVRHTKEEVRKLFGGLTRRDRFAMAAMQATVGRVREDERDVGVNVTRDDIAHEAVRQADALIAALDVEAES